MSTVVPDQEKKVKFHGVPSFPNLDWQTKKRVRIRSSNCGLWIFLSGTQWLWILSFPGAAIAFLFVSFLYPENLTTIRLRTPKIWPNRNVGCTPLEAGVLLTTASSWGLSKAFFLLVIFGSGSGSRESNVLCPLFGDAACLQGVVKYGQECLLFVPAETWQDIWRDFFSLARSWPTWQPIVRV